MPAVSDKQKHFMQAVAHNKGFAKKVGVPQSVGREFSKSGGGQVKESKGMMKKEIAFMQKKGAPKSMIKHEKAEAKGMNFSKGGGVFRKAADGVAQRGKTKGKMMRKGGKVC
jgi:hypothetical protein